MGEYLVRIVIVHSSPPTPPASERVAERLETLKLLIEAGHVKPVLDRCYPFEDLAEAHRYVEQGHKVGGVAITVSPAEG